MTGSIIFQIFIVVDVFIMGVLTSIAVRHAHAHIKTTKQTIENPNIQPTTPTIERLPAATREHLLQVSQNQFQDVLNHSSTLLQHDLDSTANKINNMVEKLATEIISDELERYRIDLGKLHNQAEADITGVKQQIDTHKEEIKNKMIQELEAEKQRLIQQIDTKLADAVGSFLVETLQHNVDLGSQSDYLIQMLEEHKADFIKEVADGPQTA